MHVTLYMRVNNYENNLENKFSRCRLLRKLHQICNSNL